MLGSPRRSPRHRHRARRVFVTTGAGTDTMSFRGTEDNEDELTEADGVRV
jgi:hypothetical protein